MTDIFLPLCHLTVFSARCAQPRGYQDRGYTLDLVIATAMGMLTLPVWEGKTKLCVKEQSRARKHQAEPVSAERSIRELESLCRRMNHATSSFIQKENKEQIRTRRLAQHFSKAIPLKVPWER